MVYRLDIVLVAVGYILIAIGYVIKGCKKLCSRLQKTFKIFYSWIQACGILKHKSYSQFIPGTSLECPLMSELFAPPALVAAERLLKFLDERHEKWMKVMGKGDKEKLEGS